MESNIQKIDIILSLFSLSLSSLSLSLSADITIHNIYIIKLFNYLYLIGIYENSFMNLML
jgi:hypothetical protein